ncbi:hypothetical protein SAMN04489740_4191 [Arthrobacter alpinus]|uniref:Uncharacterized protein n=1 Tax=Arthrobacter alpinus TaxID=656366 RepID=A0A1H5PDZ0_9MICC|nr:hypothetical protein [Arthrobacter alpinus]SEF12139.1 hypothetical protein SAMN04489740_4191 [Arthrobacter alpinus]
MDTVALLGRKYRPGVIDGAVQRALAASGAVVIAGTLSLLTYGQLTMTTDDPEMSLASETKDQSIPLELGTYQLLIRQRKNDVFEVVASKVNVGGVEPVAESIWWSE